MEAFKKWDDDYCIAPNNDCPAEGGCPTCIKLRKEGWRAAMEHMLTISENKCCFVDCIVHKAIKKELRKE